MRPANLRRWLARRREDFFLGKIKRAPVPRSVAIIMDGNGRWASERRLPRIQGHRAGTKATKRVVRAARELGVEYLTLYAFSVDNWRRPQAEVDGLMGLLQEVLEEELPELKKNGVRLKVLGHLDELPESTAKAFRRAMEQTAGNDVLTLNVALNYGGRREITDSVNEVLRDIVARVQKENNGVTENAEAGGEASQTFTVNEEDLARHLYTSGQPDPELVIRTSGELRISNFLLWQIAYAELWVTPVLWPDFSRRLFLKAIQDFQRRRRRFGGVEIE